MLSSNKPVWFITAVFLVPLISLGESTNPGLKARISQAGLNYAASITVDKMATKVQQASLPDQSGSSHVAVGKVDYRFTNMKVKKQAVLSLRLSMHNTLLPWLELL